MKDKVPIDIFILEILNNYASEQNTITQEKLLYYLFNDYSIKITRKTLSGYLAELRVNGYIKGARGVYKVNKFSDTELRLLIDSVLFAKHIPESDARTLIKKLKGMSNKQLQHRIKHVYYLNEIAHTDNNQVYHILDTIDEAIDRQRKIVIEQGMYDIYGNLVVRSTSTINPYYIVTSNARYYLICFSGRNNDLENRRIDRITDVHILEDKRMEIKQISKYQNGNFNLADYMKEHIYMFSGGSEHITIKVKKDSIGEVIDWYGKGYRITKEDEQNVTIRLYANSNAVYYWAMQYGSIVEILEPLELRNKIKLGLIDLVMKYGVEVKEDNFEKHD